MYAPEPEGQLRRDQAADRGLTFPALSPAGGDICVAAGRSFFGMPGKKKQSTSDRRKKARTCHEGNCLHSDTPLPSSLLNHPFAPIPVFSIRMKRSRQLPAC